MSDTDATERQLALHPLLQEALVDQVTILSTLTHQEQLVAIEWAKTMRETMGPRPGAEGPTALVWTGGSVLTMVKAFGPPAPAVQVRGH